MKSTTVMQRRRFLAGCLLLGGVGVSGLGMEPAVAGYRLFRNPSIGPSQLTLAMLTQAVFEPCIGTHFDIEIAPTRTERVELIEVKGYPTRAVRAGATREPFSLLFRGGKDLQVGQRIYKLTHPDLGAHEIFLVPLGPDEQGMRLEAVFS